jgi:hypothetical protein
MQQVGDSLRWMAEICIHHDQHVPRSRARAGHHRAGQPEQRRVALDQLNGRRRNK